jgi:hypothetical protein
MGGLVGRTPLVGFEGAELGAERDLIGVSRQRRDAFLVHRSVERLSARILDFTRPDFLDF